MFRIKIALLSVVLSGLVLMGLGFYYLHVMNNINMERIDREILTLGEGHLAGGPPRSYWQGFEESLKFIYRQGSSENLIIKIMDPYNEVLYQSSHWPKEITENYFPQFDRTMDTRPTDNNYNDERRGPPAGAYKACEGKSAGSEAQFVDSRGEIIIGTCEDENGKLVLRPLVNKNAREMRANDRREERQINSTPGSKQEDKPVPRLKKPYLTTIHTSSGTWRTGIMGSKNITMMVGVNMSGYYEDANRYRMAFLGTVPVALLLLAVGGWVIAKRALKPIALITRTAEGITAHALDQRVPEVEADKELSRLVEVINGMLERLEKSFGQAVRFSADAAHELQTPLTILLGELDSAVQHAPVGSEEQQRYSGLLDEVQRLKTIIQKLLILARADAGRLNLSLQPVNLSDLIESAAEDAAAMSPNLKIEKQVVPGITIMADPDMMGQAVRNLTSNAVKYNHENGFIRIKLSTKNNKAHFSISNTGVPIPAKDRDRIFDRFYRVDQSRSKTVLGSGLGLSLVREIIRAHKGEIRLDTGTGNLITFIVSIPCQN